MNTKLHIAAMALLAAAHSQAAVNIDFETENGYSALGIYDVWEESPLRTGQIAGNWAITANPDTAVNEILQSAPNPSATVLGAQRSRFGSNRMGVRIDLAESFELTPTTQYVHVMIHKPLAGRVMLVGLGSRRERLDQNKYCEQFWQPANNAVEPGRWCDAVFPIKGVAGIDIRSLVVVPDLESPHALKEDFLFYVDNIEINSSPTPRLTYDYYPITGQKETTALSRSDRYSTSASITIDGVEQSVGLSQQTDKLLYQDRTSTTFYAQAGQTITPKIGYSLNYMHSYCYLDLNQDGFFSPDNELMSYNAYSPTGNDYKNSLGQSVNSGLGNNKCGVMPAFTLPADMAPGRYRMRLKLDWNSIDPAGNADDNNLIANNGGVIVDVMLSVSGQTVDVNDFQLNGEVLAADGSKLSPFKAPYGQPFTIMMNPENGFHHDGVDIKSGFNLDGEKTDKYGNPQYNEVYVPGYMFADGLYTIPGELMRGNLLIAGRMIDNNSPEPMAEAYPVNFPKDLTITRTDRSLNSVKLSTSGTDPDATITVSSKSVYQDFTATEFSVQPGETITPTVNYTGNAMHTYWYVDLNEDGIFSTTDELLSYSYLNGTNSLGQTGVSSSMKPDTNHPFTIPAGTPSGLYRARFKIDWNYADPGGHYGTGSNDINDNGGYIVDFYIHVHGNDVAVSSTIAPQYGSLTLPTSAPYGQALTLNSMTDKGFVAKSLTVKYGYRLAMIPSFLGHEHWQTATIRPENDGSIIIPAEIMTRPVEIDGEFETAGIREVNTDEPHAIYNLQGIRLREPQHGLNIIDGKKIYKK